MKYISVIAIACAALLTACAAPRPQHWDGEPVVDLKSDFKRRTQQQLDADMNECRGLAEEVAAREQVQPRNISPVGFALRKCLVGRGWKVIG